MINSLKEANFSKEESNISHCKISNTSSSSTSWSRLKDPRIVRVSRALGGKDRHSKVCTVRGLRDRRVRLSVPTAIQLYDLQDKLGLNQPSKVVDWLLNAAKHDIDELPPLPIPPGSFDQNLRPMLTSNRIGASQSDKERFQISSGVTWNEPLKRSGSNIWRSDISLRDESKQDSGEADDNGKETWNKGNEEGKQGDLESNGAYVSSDYYYHLFRRFNHSSLPVLFNNVTHHNPFLGWNPSHLSLCQTGNLGLTLQQEEVRNVNVVPLSSILSMPSGSQLLLRPPGTAQSYLHSSLTAAVESDPKQINFQMLNSSSQNFLSDSLTPPLFSPIRPFHLSMTSNFFPSQNNNGSEPNGDNKFPSK